MPALGYREFRNAGYRRVQDILCPGPRRDFGALVYHNDSLTAGSLATLSRHEARIERALYRALNEFRRSQTLRGAVPAAARELASFCKKNTINSTSGSRHSSATIEKLAILAIPKDSRHAH